MTCGAEKAFSRNRKWRFACRNGHRAEESLGCDVKFDRRRARGATVCDDRVATCRIVQGEEAIRQTSMASINATVQVPRLKMTRVHIPFTFRLLETGNNSYEGETRHFNFKTGSRMARDSLNEIPKSLFRVSALARVERQNKRKKKRQLDSRLKNNLVTNNHRLTYQSAESSINKRLGGRQTTFNAVLAAERRGWLSKSRRSSSSSHSRHLDRGRRHTAVLTNPPRRVQVLVVALLFAIPSKCQTKELPGWDSEKNLFSFAFYSNGMRSEF